MVAAYCDEKALEEREEGESSRKSTDGMEYAGHTLAHLPHSQLPFALKHGQILLFLMPKLRVVELIGLIHSSSTE